MALRPTLSPPARSVRLPSITVAIPRVSLAGIWGWIARHREALLIASLLLIAGLAHGVNMFHFPYYEDDEGTYMSQAWAVVHLGQLAPYTYTYDHAPVGWLQIAAWTIISGGFHTFGPSTAADGRVFMLLLQVVSTMLVYGIARRVSGSAITATLATLLFALSAYGIYFHRRVLLDNITTPWMLLSIFVLLAPRPSLQKIWLSAFALSVSILSKELTVFLIPAMTALVVVRSHRSQRLFAVVGWLAIVGSFLSLYLLMAVLKGELFPPGTLLGGNSDHVSLLGTLSYQAGRGKDGGLLDLHSGFWKVTRTWVQDEPLLVIGGTLCAVFLLLVVRRRPVMAIMGMLTLSLWAFLGRGGEVIEFYLVPLLPLLAINIALVFNLVAEAIRSLAPDVRTAVARAGWTLRLIAGGAILAGIGAGYLSPNRGFAGNHALLWTSTQADAQQQAYAWIQAHLPHSDSLVMDNYAWTDLHDGANKHVSYPEAHYYWKLDEDKAVKNRVFGDRWQNVDYVLGTIQMQTDAGQGILPLTADLLKHSVTVAHFDTGGWPIDVRLVLAEGRQAPDPNLPLAKQVTFGGGMETKHAHTDLTLVNPSIQPISVRLTYYFADGTRIVRTVAIDASSRESVALGDIEPHRGSFGLVLQADRAVAAFATLRRDGTAGDMLLAGQALASNWDLRENYTGLTAQDTLTILNPDATHPAQVTLRMRPLVSPAAVTLHIMVPPRSLATKQLLPMQAAAVTITADRPVGVGQLPDFSAAGYKLAMSAKAGATATSWIATTAGTPGKGRTVITLFSPSCAATLDSSRSGGTPEHTSILTARCRAANALQSFINGGLHTITGAQRTIAQGEYAGSPGDANPGSALFGETR